MRILIVSEDIPYPNMGGLAKHALNLSRALIQAGHTVDLLGGDQHPIEVAGEEGQFGGRFFGELNGLHIGWKERKLGMFMPPRRSWLARHFARAILRHARRYDVVHYHGHVPNVARHIPREINFVQTRHDQGSDCVINTRFHNNDICTAVEPAACARCVAARPNTVQTAISSFAVATYRKEVAESFLRHKTVFVSDMLQQNFSRTMGPRRWGTTIHNFVNLEQLRRARASAAPSTAGEAINVFISGKMNPSKGIALFLRTLAPHLPSHMRVIMAGDGPDETSLRAEFESAQVQFLGWCTQEKTLHMAASAHAIVTPSVWEEPSASTILEGLLLGKATFALARGGTPELAMYGAPGQLRLHPDMPSLVRDLVSNNSYGPYAPQPEGLGGAEHAVEKLLRIYQLPPGATLPARLSDR